MGFYCMWTVTKLKVIYLYIITKLACCLELDAKPLCALDKAWYYIFFTSLSFINICNLSIAASCIIYKINGLWQIEINETSYNTKVCYIAMLNNYVLVISIRYAIMADVLKLGISYGVMLSKHRMGLLALYYKYIVN